MLPACLTSVWECSGIWVLLGCGPCGKDKGEGRVNRIFPREDRDIALGHVDEVRGHGAGVGGKRLTRVTLPVCACTHLCIFKSLGGNHLQIQTLTLGCWLLSRYTFENRCLANGPQQTFSLIQHTCNKLAVPQRKLKKLVLPAPSFSHNPNRPQTEVTVSHNAPESQGTRTPLQFNLNRLG